MFLVWELRESEGVIAGTASTTFGALMVTGDVMRKRLVLANVLVQQDRIWTPYPPREYRCAVFPTPGQAGIDHARDEAMEQPKAERTHRESSPVHLTDMDTPSAGQPLECDVTFSVPTSVTPSMPIDRTNATGQIPIGMSARREARIALQEVRARSTQGAVPEIGRLAVAGLDDADVGSLGLDLEWMRQTGERCEPSRHPDRQYGRP